MSENEVSLPVSRAFVIQLQASSKDPGIVHRGRVEHVATGKAKHFPNENELWAFIDAVLATKGSDKRKLEG